MELFLYSSITFDGGHMFKRSRFIFNKRIIEDLQRKIRELEQLIDFKNKEIALIEAKYKSIKQEISMKEELIARREIELSAQMQKANELLNNLNQAIKDAKDAKEKYKRDMR